ncbi:MAG: Glu-tRNA(Gln) amidotransferase subunit GatD, partial [Candidatus Woesearchaeota archaeon]
EEKEFIVVKLDTGYNMGIKKEKVKEIKPMGRKKEQAKAEFPKETQKPGLPTITILHTGGTIASKVDYETGGVIARFEPEEIIAMFPELKEIANIKSRLINNMFSEDMRFSHYNIIAKEIEKEIKAGASGVIVTHGTDTLHYTAAALSFMLQDLSIPVILVGAQRSSDRGSSDAALNLISAAFFIAADKHFAEVAVCMHANTEDETCIILPGTKCRKMHSSRRDAFQAINTEPIAIVNYSQKKVDMLKSEYNKTSKKPLKLMPIKDNLQIGMLKARPNMFADELRMYEVFDGLIIEGTGLGHMPINEIDNHTKEHTKILEALKKIAARIPVVMTTQTIFGQVDMNVYSTGRKLIEAGIIGNYCDTTPETAYIKLAWLLSNYPKEKIKELMSKNIAGEISERIEYKEKFVKQ